MSTLPAPQVLKRQRKNTLRMFYVFVFLAAGTFAVAVNSSQAAQASTVRPRHCSGWGRNLEFPSIPESRGHTSETHQPRSNELCFCRLATPHACCRHPATIRVPFWGLAPCSSADDRLVEHRPNSLLLAVSRMKTRLRVLRAEKEWSQADLADAVGVTRQCINAVETGKYEPGLDLAFKIARIFGKNVEDVFLYEESETSSGRQ